MIPFCSIDVGYAKKIQKGIFLLLYIFNDTVL